MQISQENLYETNSDPCSADNAMALDGGKLEEIITSCDTDTNSTEFGHFKIENNFNKNN